MLLFSFWLGTEVSYRHPGNVSLSSGLPHLVQQNHLVGGQKFYISFLVDAGELNLLTTGNQLKRVAE